MRPTPISSLITGPSEDFELRTRRPAPISLVPTLFVGPRYNIFNPFYYKPQPKEPETAGTKAKESVRETVFPKPGDVVPLCLGKRKVPGQYVYINVISGVLHVICIFCEGEIDAYEQILVNDKEISYYSTSIYHEKYYGTMTQPLCSLNQYDSNWNDRLAGTVYIYFRFTKTEQIQDLPTIFAIIRGVKVYDPRTGFIAYSTNPALHLAHILTNKRYGCRISTAKINWDSVSNAANWCDTIIGTSQQEKRFEFNYYFGSEDVLENVIETIRRHFIGAILIDNDKFKIEYGRQREVVASFAESEIWDLSIAPLSSSDIINLVNWMWTNPTTWDQISESIEDPNITTNNHEIYEGTYDLTGCLSYSQSLRIATFLINSRLADLIVSFQTYNDKGLQPLDVFEITHSIGLSNKKLYVSEIEQLSDGSWRIVGIEYDPAFFLDEVITEPTYPDTNLPHPSDPPPNVEKLSLSEKLEQLKDSTWISTIQASWTTPTDWPFIKHYEVYSKKGSENYSLLGITTGTTFEVKAVEELKTYYIKVITFSTWDIKSIGVETNIVPQGKYLKPVWKSGAALSAVEAGDMVILKWAMANNTRPAEDIDITGYEIRRGKTTDTWETAGFITFIDALVFMDKNCPSGTWRYFIKAKDSVENYTETAKYVDVEVTLNPYFGFQQNRDIDLDGASVTNATVERVYFDMDWGFPSNNYLWSQRFNVTKAWNDATQTYPLSSYPQWIVPVPTSGSITSLQIDLGQIISGRWTLHYDWAKIGTGTTSVTPKLLLSNNGVDWTEYNALSAFSAQARYVKAKFEFSSTNDNTTYIVKEPVYVNIQADPKEDYGQVTVPAGGSYSITFAITFLSIEKISLTPLTSVARIVVADNLTLTSFNLKMFDTNGNAAGGNCKWRVEGY
jgi:hypothetical protein